MIMERAKSANEQGMQIQETQQKERGRPRLRKSFFQGKILGTWPSPLLFESVVLNRIGLSDKSRFAILQAMKTIKALKLASFGLALILGIGCVSRGGKPAAEAKRSSKI